LVNLVIVAADQLVERQKDGKPSEHTATTPTLWCGIDRRGLGRYLSAEAGWVLAHVRFIFGGPSLR